MHWALKTVLPGYEHQDLSAKPGFEDKPSPVEPPEDKAGKALGSVSGPGKY